MLTRFFTPVEVIDYFERGVLEEDLLDGRTIAIGSIADLLDICEAYKKGNLNISGMELQGRFDAFNAGPIQGGAVFIIDLDQDNLSSALFERESGIVVGLWDQATRRSISPRRSIRYLTLRITDDVIWWPEDVYRQMEEYHVARDR